MKTYCDIIPMTNLLSKHFYGSKVFSQSRCNVETFQECLIYLELPCITSSLHNLICKYYSAGVNGSKKKLVILFLASLEFDQDGTRSVKHDGLFILQNKWALLTTQRWIAY